MASNEDELLYLLEELEQQTSTKVGAAPRLAAAPSDVATKRNIDSASSLGAHVWYEILQHKLFVSERTVEVGEEGAQKEAVDLLEELTPAVQQEMEVDLSSDHAPLHLDHCSEPVEVALAVVCENPYDRDAWGIVLNEIQPPVSVKHSRHIWLRFCQLYPRCGHHVSEYLSLEVNELSESIAAGASIKELAAATLRLVMLFEKHLCLCDSVRLHRLLIDWLRQRSDGTRRCVLWGSVADSVVEHRFKVALETVGKSLDAGPLWTDFLMWKKSHLQDPSKMIPWVRGMYHLILQTPLEGLDAIRDEYNNWELSTHDRRFQLEERLQRSFARVASLTLPERRTRYEKLSIDFLPRPLRLCYTDTTQSATDLQHWEAWEEIMAFERKSEGTDSPKRIVLALRQRLCYFPFEVSCWLELVEWHAQREETALATHYFQEAMRHHPRCLLTTAKYSDYLSSTLGNVQDATVCFRVLMDRLRGELQRSWGKEAPEGPVARLKLIRHEYSVLQSIFDAHLLWMRWSRFAFAAHGADASRLVASFGVKETKLLPMVFRFLKLRGVGSVDKGKPDPVDLTIVSASLQLICVFCSEWMRVELFLCRQPQNALHILKGWIAHLVQLVDKTKWFPSTCGVTDGLLHSCVKLAVVEPALRDELHEIVCDLSQRCRTKLNGQQLRPYFDSNEFEEEFAKLTASFQLWSSTTLAPVYFQRFLSGPEGRLGASCWTSPAEQPVAAMLEDVIGSRSTPGAVKGVSAGTGKGDMGRDYLPPMERDLVFSAIANSSEAVAPIPSRWTPFTLPQSRTALRPLGAPTGKPQTSEAGGGEPTDAELAQMLELSERKGQEARQQNVPMATQLFCVPHDVTMISVGAKSRERRTNTDEAGRVAKRQRLEQGAGGLDAEGTKVLSAFVKRLPARHMCTDQFHPFFLTPEDVPSSVREPSGATLPFLPSSKWIATQLRQISPVS